MYRQLRTAVLTAGHEGRVDLQYMYFGNPVCRPAFESLWHCSCSVVRRYREQILKGNTEAQKISGRLVYCMCH